MLFNLCGVEGAEHRYEYLREANIESGVADLEAAEIFHYRAIHFRFRAETGRRGADYDIEAFFEIPIACESKCKLETTRLTAKTVTETLDVARGQLPTDRPGLVFLRLPEPWVLDAPMQQLIDDGIHTMFRKTGRISAVIVHWREWQPHASEGAVALVKSRAKINPSARHSAVALAEAVRQMQVVAGPWRRFSDIFKGR